MRLTLVAFTRRAFLHIYMYIPILLFNKLPGEFKAAAVFLYFPPQPTDIFFVRFPSTDIFC
jgi:hypothetical protein